MTQPGLILYTLPHSSYGAKIAIVLAAKGVAYTAAPPPGGLRSAAYRRRVPMGTIPALVDGDFVLSESEAIAEYLEETQIIAGQPGIIGTNEILTLHFGPEDVLLTVSLDFVDALSSADIETAISDMEHQIKTRFPEITRVFIEAQSRQRHRAAARRAAAAADE